MNRPQVALPIGRYRARFRAESPVRLPPYPGSAWRGAFGHALKRALCVTHLPVCSDCALWRSCGYAYVFETPPPAQTEKMRKYTAAPHPFVLDLEPRGGTFAAGSESHLGITLIGHGNRHLGPIIHALEQAAANGIGQGRGRLSLIVVEQHSTDWQVIYRPGGVCEAQPAGSPEIPPPFEYVRLILESPLRLKREGGVVGVQDFSFSALFSNLLRRVSLLTYFHTDTPLETDFADLARAAHDVRPLRADLRWFDWGRYSARQQRKMKLGGLLGEIVFDGAALEPFWPYLWLGQYVHAGAVTSMGLGRYRIEPAASLPEQTEPGAPVETIRP